MRCLTCKTLLLLLATTTHKILAGIPIPKVDADPIPADTAPTVPDDISTPDDDIFTPNDSSSPDSGIHISQDVGNNGDTNDNPSDPSKSNLDDSEPHAPILPVHVSVPEHPCGAEEKESELGEDLHDLADFVSSVYDLANPTSTTATGPTATEDTTAESTITPPPSNANATACLSANEGFRSCVAATTSVDFTQLVRSDQASCLCYGAASNPWYWQPSAFDNYMTSCGAYAATASGGGSGNGGKGAGRGRGVVGGAAGLCNSVGDVRTTAVVGVGGSGSGNEMMTTTEMPTLGTTSSAVSGMSAAAATGSGAVSGAEGREGPRRWVMIVFGVLVGGVLGGTFG